MLVELGGDLGPPLPLRTAQELCGIFKVAFPLSLGGGTGSPAPHFMLQTSTHSISMSLARRTHSPMEGLPGRYQGLRQQWLWEEPASMLEDFIVGWR